MSIGLGIFLIVVGAILTFAIHVTVASIDLALVGWILMAAGVVVVGLGIFFVLRKRQSIATTRVSNDSVSGEKVTQHELRDDAV
jgi:hypothetical protein